MQIRCCLYLPFHRFVAVVRFCLEVLSLFQDLLRYLFNSKNLSPVCSIYAQSQRITKFHGVKSGSRISGRGRAPSGVTAGREGWRGVLKVFWLYGKREKRWTGPVSAARFPRGGTARPLPPEPIGRRRSWRRIHWPTESPRRHPGARAGPLRGRRTSRPIPFAWQWPAARPAPACRRKASGRWPSQP